MIFMGDRKVKPLRLYVPKDIGVLNVQKLFKELHFFRIQAQNKTIIMVTD